MPRYPHLEQAMRGPQPDSSMPAYWADGPVYRLELPNRGPIYYRAEGVYPSLPVAPPPSLPQPVWVPPPSCASCRGVNNTQSVTGAICMGCFSERRRRHELPPPPPPPPVPRFTKADAAKILGVKWPGATHDDVVEAYRMLVLKAHADRNGGTDERLIEILRARDRMIPPPKQVQR